MLCCRNFPKFLDRIAYLSAQKLNKIDSDKIIEAHRRHAKKHVFSNIRKRMFQIKLQQHIERNNVMFYLQTCNSMMDGKDS